MRRIRGGKRFAIPRCRQYRHWFTYRGAVGTIAPTCRRCGVPNPYASDEEMEAEWDEDERQEWRAAKAALESPVR